MKKRILAFLLAVSIAVSMLVLPASAAGNANTAVQLSITLNAMDSSQQAALNAVVTRGALARMLVSYSTYRESVGSQGTVGTLFTDLPGTSPYAPYVRIAVQNGWMNGYTDGSFRPDNAVTLEEAVTAILKLMGYKMTDLSGSFPNAQLNKASELGLRNQVDRSQGEALNYEECALLFYNALTANTASGSAYGSSLGFTVSNGQVDTSSVMLKSLKGPFVAGDTVQLPFVPKMVYRNDKASESAELNKYDVYYYSESLQTLWVYTRRAAGRITAVSPSASAPTSVTVAGTSYTLGSSAVASQVSSLNGGGVGEVVTLLLGMNNEAAGIVTGEEADSVFYGVVQTATRSLVEENGADVLQKVSVMCTDGIARTVNVDKSLNFPQGWLVEIKVTPEGESVEHIEDRRVNGTINTNGTALGAAALADDVEILDTTSEGVAGTVRPSRLSGVTLSDLDVRYYTVNDAGQIDRLILNDVTGDLWSYGVLDDVKNLAMNYSDLKSLVTGIAAGGHGRHRRLRLYLGYHHHCDRCHGGRPPVQPAGAHHQRDPVGHRLGRYPEHGLAEADQQHRLPDEHWLPADRGDHGHPLQADLQLHRRRGDLYLLRQRRGGQLHHGHQVSGAGGRHCRAAGDHRLCQGHDAADAPEDRQGRRGLGALGQ